VSAIFELWDTETANLVGTYKNEESALAVVRDAVRAYGPEAIAPLVLGCEDERGRSTPIAGGAALVELAEARAPDSMVVTAPSTGGT